MKLRFRKSLAAILGLLIALSACDEKTKAASSEVGANLWGEAGRVTYPESAATMRENAPPGEYLSQRDRDALRPVVGALVDQVIVHYGAKPLNELASEQYSIPVIGVDTEAQAFGYEVYIRAAKAALDDYKRLELLLHELKHSEQFSGYGDSYEEFGYAYFHEYAAAGFQYAANRLELEADEQAEANIDAVYQRFAQPTKQQAR